jgi:hypothetical protein
LRMNETQEKRETEWKLPRTTVGQIQ